LELREDEDLLLDLPLSGGDVSIASPQMLKVNFIEITLLVEAFLPVAFCLQETYLKKSDNINLKKIFRVQYLCR
jgi:hypothetical protein